MDIHKNVRLTFRSREALVETEQWHALPTWPLPSSSRNDLRMDQLFQLAKIRLRNVGD
jgi:hypothetical protein